MQQEPLNHLQKNVLYLKIVPVNQVQADTKMLADLLNAVNASFENFVLAELASRNSNIKPALKKEHQLFAGECCLLIRNILVEDLVLMLEINISTETAQYKAIKNVPELKQEIFDLFVNAVFNPDLFTTDSVQYLSGRYNSKERISVFSPIFDVLDQQKFSLSFGTNTTEINSNWTNSNDLILRSSLIPETIKLPKEKVESYYQFIKTGEENDLFGKRSKYEKVLIKENPKHDLYPYQLQKITVKGKKYIFNKQLAAAVAVKNNFYEISFPELSISVKHDTRTGAEKAFDVEISRLITQLEKEQSYKNAILIKLKRLLNEY